MRASVLVVCLARACFGWHMQHARRQESSLKAFATLLLDSHPAAAYSPSISAHAPMGVKRQTTPVASASSRRQVVAGAAAAAAATVLPIAANAADYPKVRITTNKGDMEFELWNDVAPKTVENFLKLTKEGFYDGGAFHRIIPGFVIQGGDPNAKLGYRKDGALAKTPAERKQQALWGTGGPGYTIPAEFNSRLHEFGVLSMARSKDPDSAGSQFFVCLGRLQSLDNQYTVFGKITKGEDVLQKLGSADTDGNERPLTRQGIDKVDAL